MEKTRRLKVVLDIVLTAALLTLYSKNFIGMKYHEIAGLAVLVPILIHIGLNIKMIRGMCKNFKRIPLNVKLCLIVDILLMLTFLWLGVSGVLISKTILTGISASSRMVQSLHMAAGGLSAILLGIHLGLHLCRKEMNFALAIGLTVVALAAGAYGYGTSNLTGWLVRPFVSVGSAPEGAGFDKGQLPEGFDESQLPEGVTFDKDNWPEGFDKSSRPEGVTFDKDNRPEGFDKSNMPSGGTGNRGGRGQGGSTPLQKVLTLIRFFGIIFSGAMITYWIVWLKRSRTENDA